MKIEDKKSVVCHQIVEAIRWYARNDGMNVTEILNKIESDILHGRYEREDLPDELKFWEQ